MSSIDTHTEVEETVETTELPSIMRNTMIPDTVSVRKPLLHNQQSKRVLVTELSMATRQGQQLGFIAHSIYVSNWTSLWLYIPCIDQYIPPNTGGWLLPIAAGTQLIDAFFDAPPGIAQPSSTGASSAQVTYYEQQYVPTFAPTAIQ